MLFSVIVPIYNIEPYLRECVDSILAQTFADFELILVDDGSPDGCGKICDMYAEADRRVQVIHKTNGGLVSARQAGIRRAVGHYIVHVDGDDWISPVMLERAKTIIEETDADVVSFSFHQVSESESRICHERLPEGFYEGQKLRDSVYPRILMDKDMQPMSYSLWGKALRRSLVTEPQLSVPVDIALGEDLACMAPVYMKMESLFISWQPVYYYRYRETSMSQGFKTGLFGQFLRVARLLDEMPHGGVADFEEQCSRYVSFISFGLWNGMALTKTPVPVEVRKQYMENPVIKKHLQAAEFGTISPLPALVYRLFRRNQTEAAYYLLRFYRMVSRG